jgi:hypothetical protein
MDERFALAVLAESEPFGSRVPGLERAVPCPESRYDYLRIAAWFVALLFGPVLVALTVLIVSGVV